MGVGGWGGGGGHNKCPRGGKCFELLSQPGMLLILNFIEDFNDFQSIMNRKGTSPVMNFRDFLNNNIKISKPSK